jgi:hypothetical protein
VRRSFGSAIGSLLVHGLGISMSETRHWNLFSAIKFWRP